ncbi:MAG TPA: acyl-CoA dehydrogenase family protein [Steroidobacteraceae bacterium]|jgi:acyl-CoA dehydrogenase|nr:acyl-CoA dehydrogenase family protein [Steroidobacteraceae bacterium]
MATDTHRATSAHNVTNLRQSDLTARARAAAEIARVNAAAVDAEARFPGEAFAELRKQRLLGIQVPQALGGESATIAEIADICYILGQACSSTALIYAMHQIKIACIVRHYKNAAALERVLRRIAAEQLLMASSTTEGQAGGNVRSSEAPVEHDGEQVTLERKATVISYAVEADGIVTTARRAADAAGNDQVLLVLLKADYTLERLQVWDTLGMRGTHSEGFTLRARAAAGQLLPEPYERIHAQTMVPFAHLLWGSVWAGIAAAAAGKAQGFIRHVVRQSNGQMPPGAAHFTQAVSSLRTLRGVLSASLRSYEAIMSDEKAISSLEFQATITLTKVQVSELAVTTVLGSLRACGLSGYRNDTEFTIGRLLRDVLSAPLMISNDRILTNLATTSLMTPLPTSISG